MWPYRARLLSFTASVRHAPPGQAPKWDSLPGVNRPKWEYAEVGDRHREYPHTGTTWTRSGLSSATSPVRSQSRLVWCPTCPSRRTMVRPCGRSIRFGLFFNAVASLYDAMPWHATPT